MNKQAIFNEVKIGQLKLDRQNPRLPEKLKGSDDKTILNWMLSDATLIDLMASIAENGFFPGEPIIAINDGNGYVVIEGNRRLAAIRLLATPELAVVSPKAVETLSVTARQKNSIPEKVWLYIVENRNEVGNYLAFRHVTGVKSWPVISKARYLNSLFLQRTEKSPDVYKYLAKEIGSKASYVRRLLIGYQAFELIQSRKFYNISDLDEENFDLSLITDALTMHPAIAEYMGVSTETDWPLQELKNDKLKQVTEWLYSKLANGRTRVGESRNLRVLNKVVQSPNAVQAFASGEKTLSEAAEMTDFADENIRLYLSRAMQNMAEAQKIVHRSSHPDKSDKRVVEEIIDSAELILKALNGKLREQYQG
ncbi:MAG: ParB/RepB/Spo0J family partition protein [Candidatus Riflebacteria bacterium]|nr:ParB/RepB/Spo0J family partition protein [Candidatus Riflebacteria bacterium]